MNRNEIKLLEAEFNDILQDIWCIYSFHNGVKKLREIGHKIKQPYMGQIWTEISHIGTGHGSLAARLQIKDIMQKYLEDEYRNGE